MPGAHKIGAAISGRRIAGGKITDTRIFLNAATSSWKQVATSFAVAICLRLRCLCGAKWTNLLLAKELAISRALRKSLAVAALMP